MDKKQRIVKQFQDILQNYPLAYLIFGSVGRGCYRHNSDIDSLIVFQDKDIDLFISNEFIKQLPLLENKAKAESNFLKALSMLGFSQEKINQQFLFEKLSI